MNEAAIRLEISHTLNGVGFCAYHPPDRFAEDGGRIDIYALNPVGPTIVVEVKDIQAKSRIEEYLDPREISVSQRRWMDWWTWGRGGQAYLGLGTVTRPRRLWIIPWDKWNQAEREQLLKCDNLLGNCLESLRMPIRVIEKIGWSLSNPKGPYELSWNKGRWTFQDTHPIMNIKRKEVGAWDWNKPISLRFAEKEKKINGT